MLALAAVLSLTAFYKVCTGFRFWDDMGYVMLTQKTLAAGHPLYDQTYTQYGPAYYAWKQLLHAATGLRLSHDSTALFTTATLMAAVLLCAGYVARMTRSLLLTVLACFGVFYLLQVLMYEPGHPQEFCVLLLAAMLFVSTFLVTGRHTGALLGLLGFLVGLLGMTKPNLGVYAAVAGWVSAGNLLADRRLRLIVFGSGALAAAALPVCLMRHNLESAGDYCLLTSGAALLLIGRLALSRPKQGLPWRVLVTPVAGCLAAVLACAAYALAKGTSMAGLIHGLVLQHVGYDKVYFRWPEFGTDEVVLSLGVGLLLWAATGPARAFWRDAPWVPTAIGFSVAPAVLAIALLAGPWEGPTFDWLKPVFTWCVPLVAAVGMMSVQSPATVWETAPRQIVLALAVMSALWGYPVWGSQAQFSFFLFIPVTIVGTRDALRGPEWGLSLGNIQHPPSNIQHPTRQAAARIGCWLLDVGCWMFPISGAGAQSASRPVRSGVSWIAVLGILCLSVVQANRASRAYHRLAPSGLPGSSLLRMPPEQSGFYRQVLASARAHGRSFYTMPGIGSLYFWGEQEPPTARLPGNWMTLLGEEEQAKVVEELARTPDLCVVRWNPGVGFWTHGRDISSNRIVRYIEDNHVTVESIEQCDIMVRRQP